MSEPTSAPSRDDPFFIGWLPVPPGHARFLAPVVALLLAVAAVSGAFLAYGQRPPGTGTWDDDASRSFEDVAYRSAISGR